MRRNIDTSPAVGANEGAYGRRFWDASNSECLQTFKLRKFASQCKSADIAYIKM